MSKTRRYILSLVVLIALLAIPTFVVFAKELSLLVISGPGIDDQISLNDPDDMAKLEQSGLFDQVTYVQMPENLGEGYNITAHLNLDGTLVPYVEMIYYPAEEGQRGYIHYIRRLSGETMKEVDRWGQILPKAEVALRDVMISNEIALQSAVPYAAVAPAQPAVVEPVIAAEPAAAEPVEPVIVEPVAEPAVEEPNTVPTVQPGTESPYFVIALVATILMLFGAGFVVRRRSLSHPSA